MGNDFRALNAVHIRDNGRVSIGEVESCTHQWAASTELRVRVFVWSKRLVILVAKCDEIRLVMR